MTGQNMMYFFLGFGAAGLVDIIMVIWSARNMRKQIEKMKEGER